MSLSTVPTVEDLATIAGQVWSSYLDPDGSNPLVAVASVPPHGDVVASVAISGSWSGHVVVACSGSAARNVAAAFLMATAEEVTGDDIADVLGELANIVGGNVKAMLPPASFVSLPQVVTGSEAAVHWPSCVQIAELAGRWQGEPLSISVWQKTDLGSAGL